MKLSFICGEIIVVFQWNNFLVSVVNEIELFVRIYIDAEMNDFFLREESEHSYLFGNGNLVMSFGDVFNFQVFLTGEFVQDVCLFFLESFLVSQKILFFLLLRLFSKTVLFCTGIEIAYGGHVGFFGFFLFLLSWSLVECFCEGISCFPVLHFCH